MNALADLIKLLQVKEVEPGKFLGKSQDLGYGRLFGGQVLGQALAAAHNTVNHKLVHSLNSYFLRPGNPSEEILYEVDLIRDGKSFATRRVVALQKGEAIFNMAASFQIKEKGVEHYQPISRNIPGPEGLPSEIERAKNAAEEIPEKVRAKMICEKPIEVRVVKPTNYCKPARESPENHLWMRAVATLPNNPVIHRCVLAYASDFGLLGTSLRPHGISMFQKNIQVASLDHAMWFHRNFYIDSWLLYEVESTNASGARGLNFGRFYDSAGKLVASTAQEGLIRKHEH